MAPAQATGRCFPVTRHRRLVRRAISPVRPPNTTARLISTASPACAAERGSALSGLSWSSGWPASPSPL